MTSQHLNMSGDRGNYSYMDFSEYYGDLDLGSLAPCNYSSLSNFGKVFLPFLYSLVFILGFLGNGLVLCVLIKHRNQTNLTDICLFNLALSDLLFILTLPLYSHYSAVGQWVFGDFMCHLSGGMHNTGFFSSTFFMVAMTLDRYMAIMYAHKVAKYRTLKMGVTLSGVVWMLSLCASLPSFIFTKETDESIDEPSGKRCQNDPENKKWNVYNILATNILGLMIPFSVMVICYSRIIPTLMHMRSVKKHRAVKLIISIMIIFFLFWAPYNFILLLDFIQSDKESCEWINNIKLSATVTETIAFTHCCLNPIIYAFVGQKFMKRSLQLLRTWVPGIPFSRRLSESSFRTSSVMSRASDVTTVM
ncbi:C-C chemokine receptor type 5-like [Sphaeramia orbicularis]|uniref:C-C chemokine receptor type 5-like n=1 Tax=Sphaeramia orbicularis TaxID=375764 RepID=A0A673CRP5_9TELE|nr:C-C chemokine receptor type 5-like [Sphaeramia orbicularis]